MSETVESRWGTGANAEAIQAWDGPLFDRFVRYRHIVVAGLAQHGKQALELAPPQAGQRVLDIGCGFGDASQVIAGLVGPEGEVVGVDAAARFIEAAQAEAKQAGVANARFSVTDVQDGDLGGPYDAAFSRMGTMFFANPVAALRNVHGALVPDAPLTMVVWRRREDNDWLYRAQQIVEGFLTRPEEHDEPTCGPGPFSMSGADTTSDILLAAGFKDITLHRCDLPMLGGHSIDEAIDLVMALGPAGELVRLAGDSANHLHEPIREALIASFAEIARPDGEVWTQSSTWIVSAAA
jgi:SAM-dependent methyltransferase